MFENIDQIIQLVGLVAAIVVALMKHIRAGKAEAVAEDLQKALAATISGVELASKLDKDDAKWNIYKAQLSLMQESFGVRTDIIIPKLREIAYLVENAISDKNLMDALDISKARNQVINEVGNQLNTEKEKAKSGTFKRVVMVTVACLCVVALSAGCALFEPTAGQKSGIVSRTKYYEPAEKTVLLSKTTTIDENGNPVVEEIYGAPHVPKETSLSVSSEFEDSDLGIDATVDNIGSGLIIGREGIGNDKTLGKTTSAQVQRLEATGEIIEGAIAGAVKAAIEYALPVRLAEEETARAKIAADRDVNMAHNEEVSGE